MKWIPPVLDAAINLRLIVCTFMTSARASRAPTLCALSGLGPYGFRFRLWQLYEAVNRIETVQLDRRTAIRKASWRGRGTEQKGMSCLLNESFI